MAGHDRLTPEGIRFYRQLGELKKLQVRVGFQRGQAAEDPDGQERPDLVDIAMWNELGVPERNIPARPFLRDSIDKHEPEVKQFCETLSARFLRGEETAESMLKKIGVMQKAAIQSEIVNGDFKANSQKYVDKLKAEMQRKNRLGPNESFVKKPLIDTGIMRQSVSFVIKLKGED